MDTQLFREELEARGYNLDDYNIFPRTYTLKDVSAGTTYDYKVGGDILVLGTVVATGSIADLEKNLGNDFLTINSMKDDWTIREELLLEKAQETLTAVIFFGRTKNFKILTSEFSLKFATTNLFDIIYNVVVSGIILQRKQKRG